MVSPLEADPWGPLVECHVLMMVFSSHSDVLCSEFSGQPMVRLFVLFFAPWMASRDSRDTKSSDSVWFESVSGAELWWGGSSRFRKDQCWNQDFQGPRPWTSLSFLNEHQTWSNSWYYRWWIWWSFLGNVIVSYQQDFPCCTDRVLLSVLRSWKLEEPAWAFPSVLGKCREFWNI